MDLAALLPSIDLGTGIALATACLGALGYLASRRQAKAAERANELTKQELAATTAQSNSNQSELLGVLAHIKELYARIEAQQQAIDECHRERLHERAARERLDAQLQSERLSNRVRVEQLVEEVRQFRREYTYLKEVYIALSGGWVDALPAPPPATGGRESNEEAAD